MTETTPTTPHPDAAALDALGDRIDGPLLRPGDAGYDDERAGFQAAVDHRPAAVVGVTGPRDVRAAVTHAGEHGLPIAVQATGHGPARAATGGLLLSTRRMNGVRVDARARTAHLEAGVRWDSVIEEAARHGLAPLSGSSPHIGAVGYTLGGGLGLLGRTHGYAADHVRGIDVVTADGAVRHATPDRHPDLFWALRGGRDNLGVVTGLEIDLLPVTRVHGGGLFFAADLAETALRRYLEWTATVPEETNSSLALVPFPDIPAIPEPLRGRFVAHVRIAHTGSAREGERLVAPLRAIGPRLLDTLDELAYTATASIHNDPTTPMPTCSDSVTLGAVDPASAARTILDLAGPDAPVRCIVEVRHLGGALARQPAVPNAVGHRDAHYTLGVISRVDSTTLEVARAAQRRLVDAIAPWTVGRFLNFMGYGATATAEHVRTAYSTATYERLRQVKAAHDPDNLFRANHNIPPALTRSGEQAPR